MKIRSTVLVAAAVCVHQVESFAPTTRPLDQRLSEKLSERKLSTVPPETSRRKRLQVQQIERQYHFSPALRLRQRPTTSEKPKQKKSSPGLTRDEEVAYTYQIRTFRAVMRLREQLVQQMGSEPSTKTWAAASNLTPKELRLILAKGQAARTAVVDANIGLVTAFAKRQYTSLRQATTAGGGVGTILTLQDMIQEGNLGLMEAAERFEPEKGFRFSTYATWWVRQRILRSISDSSRTIRLPAHVHSMLQKMRKAKIELQSQIGREPTTLELASVLQVSEEKLQLYAESSRNVVSLERPLHSASFKEDERTLGDTLASDAPTPLEETEADYLRRDIRAVMNTALADAEKLVISHRFGFEDGKSRTVAETASLLSMTRDRVRLVEARALNKLRHPQRNYKLKEYIHVGAAAATETTMRSAVQVPTERSRPSQDKNRIWFF